MNVQIDSQLTTYLILERVPPEEGLAGLTGHGVKVTAEGAVATHTTDLVLLVRVSTWTGEGAVKLFLTLKVFL